MATSTMRSSGAIMARWNFTEPSVTFAAFRTSFVRNLLSSSATPSVSKLVRALRNPIAALDLVLALAKGHFYKVWLPLRGIRFSAGRNLKVFGTLKVRGPGRVIFGDNVIVGMVVTPFTHDRDAVLHVGNHCFLNGVRFGCARAITIGDDCILAESRVMDSNFHSTRADRWNPDAPVRIKPVRIERNVWVAAEAGILPGTTIGENSVVGFGSVCSGAYPANVLVAGNPGVVVRELDSIPSAESIVGAIRFSHDSRGVVSA